MVAHELADQLARSRLSAASSSSSAPPAAPDSSRSGAFDDSDIPPSTSPGVYFCEVRGRRVEGKRDANEKKKQSV